MRWQVEWTARALKDLKKLDPRARQRVVSTIERFAQSGSGKVVQLTDLSPPEWRLRIGDLRARFRREFDRESLQILRVLPRDKAY